MRKDHFAALLPACRAEWPLAAAAGAASGGVTRGYPPLASAAVIRDKDFRDFRRSLHRLSQPFATN